MDGARRGDGIGYASGPVTSGSQGLRDDDPNGVFRAGAPVAARLFDAPGAANC